MRIPELGILPEIRQLGTTRQRARKVHICSVCAQPIAIGSTYERIMTIDLSALNPKHRAKVIKWHLPHCPEA